MGEFFRNPVQFIRRNTDPRTVTSVAVATVVIGVGLTVASKFKPLRPIVRAVQK